MAEVQSSNERTNEEKNAMLEILKRLQDEQAEEGNDEERDDDLADKLADVDIGGFDMASDNFQFELSFTFSLRRPARFILARSFTRPGPAQAISQHAARPSKSRRIIG